MYTELLTPEWYSSGGMTPGHGGATMTVSVGAQDTPFHGGSPCQALAPVLPSPHLSGGTSSPGGSILHGCTKTQLPR